MSEPARGGVKFWLPCTVVLLMAAAAFAFFLIGIADGSVSSFNFGLWLAILTVAAGIPAGAFWLRASGHTTAAAVLLWIAATPGLLAVVFFLTVILSGERWN